MGSRRLDLVEPREVSRNKEGLVGAWNPIRCSGVRSKHLEPCIGNSCRIKDQLSAKRSSEGTVTNFRA